MDSKRRVYPARGPGDNSLLRAVVGRGRVGYGGPVMTVAKPEFVERADIIVVGAGVMGLWTALTLRDRRALRLGHRPEGRYF